jgi:hypothetical protein
MTILTGGSRVTSHSYGAADDEAELAKPDPVALTVGWEQSLFLRDYRETLADIGRGYLPASCGAFTWHFTEALHEMAWFAAAGGIRPKGCTWWHDDVG